MADDGRWKVITSLILKNLTDMCRLRLRQLDLDKWIKNPFERICWYMKIEARAKKLEMINRWLIKELKKRHKHDN